ncbi:hypothetical protein FBY35_5065 [Streptomyces sp. SLBN-118]|uniref:hypothetical protein n=1 Tax=Streptomyces sp. SLBN-118 TaxID=2768454 RepID=UPI00114FCC99|nr:hypothetical protein [Streptomyces sp. SLBN-118]TQK43596.1 hypothetical protein FBY35_5065 [Streptomyces sp. SLBN-118]
MPTSRLLCWGGLAAASAGAVLSVIGWYGVSGERFAERQIPYLASCTVPGAALLVAGAVLLAAAGRLMGPWDGEEAGVPEAPVSSPEVPPFEPPSSEGPVVCVPGGTLAHRPDCPLVAGKPEVEPVGDRVLGPCPVCEPQV